MALHQKTKQQDELSSNQRKTSELEFDSNNGDFSLNEYPFALSEKTFYPLVYQRTTI